jgi:hypothetical protein
MIAGQVLLFGGSVAFIRYRYRLTLPLRVVLTTGWMVACLAVAGFLGAFYSDGSAVIVTTKLLLYGLVVMTALCCLPAEDRHNVRQFANGLRTRFRSAVALGR